nr:MAG TPA: hypothetical protein [Caudoviricetes sp.]
MKLKNSRKNPADVTSIYRIFLLHTNTGDNE